MFTRRGPSSMENRRQRPNCFQAQRGWGSAPRKARTSPWPPRKVELNRLAGISRAPSSRLGFPCTTDVPRNAAPGPTNRSPLCFLHGTCKPVTGQKPSDVTSQQFHARAWPKAAWTGRFCLHCRSWNHPRATGPRQSVPGDPRREGAPVHDPRTREGSDP
uniref:Uncharacterized protein n=1 Tax=Molossus molossus TaxID=27622 RepID=A0A7J8BYJ9_MOLMO|nr:hypothetical protein HJG59_010076 [Molossus molossus]